MKETRHKIQHSACLHHIKSPEKTSWRWEKGLTAKGHVEYFKGKIELWQWLYNSVNLLKIIELCS